METRHLNTASPEETKAGNFEKLSVTLLFLLAIGCSLNTLWNTFVYDDELQILQNPYIKSWHYLPEIFTTTVWSFIGAAGASNYYRPLMTLTYLGLWKVFGALPIGFHLFNILVNALVVACVFYAGRRLLRDQWAALIAAILFALHPVHTEAVNWVAAVADLEATLFFLVGFYAYAKAPGPDGKRQSVVMICLLLALLAKEPALMLVPVLVYYEHFVREGSGGTAFAAKVKRYLPVCMVGSGYLLLRVALFGKLAPVLQHAQITWPQAIYSAFALVAQYSKLLLWPSPLSAFHVFHPSYSLNEQSVILGAGIMAGCTAFASTLHKRWPVPAFCVIWIGVTLAPVLNARWMASNVLTERYLFLPSVGFCWLVGILGKEAWDRLGKNVQLQMPLRVALCTVGIALAVLGATRTWARNQIWHDDLTLYSKTVETDPDSYVMRMNLGVTYFAAHDFPASERELQRALELKPDSANVLNALGCLYLEEGRLEEAARTFQGAIRFKPNWTDSHFNFGRLLSKMGKNDQALAEFRTAVEVGPVNASARLYLAQELEARGKVREAEAEYRTSIQLAPSLIAQQNLADILLRTGRDGAAKPLLEQMAKEYPFDSTTHLKLGRVLETEGRLAEAGKEYQATLETDPANAEAQGAIKRLGSSPK